MADIIYRFDNTPWGGSHNVTLTNEEMPDWSPVSEEVKETIMRGSGGKLWKYTWYRKGAFNISFKMVGTSILATMGSMARAGLSIRWYKDLYNSGGTGTIVYIGGPFTYTPYSPKLHDFDFPVEELE
jgi:hypothetical protein